MAKTGMKVSKAKPKSKECKCIEQVNELLKDQNAAIAQNFLFANSGSINMSPPFIRLEKSDPKKRSSLPNVLCAYCPFCGKKYPE